MKKKDKDIKIPGDEAIGNKEENIETAAEEKPVKKLMGILNEIIGKVKSKLKKNPEESEEPVREDREKEEKEKKPRKPFPFKEILIVVALSGVLSLLILFLMNLGGIRTSVRSSITDFLLGKEKEILVSTIEAEYQQRIDAELADLLVKERENLVEEYEALTAEKEALDKREKDISKLEATAQNLIAEVETEKSKVLEQQAILEGKIAEIKDLAKIYESMEPANAANIMTEMEDEKLLLGIVGNMKEDAVAEILELMETAKAADITSKMGQ